MNTVAKLVAVSFLALLATGCASNKVAEQRADQAIAIANEAKAMAAATQAQLDKMFRKDKYK